MICTEIKAQHLIFAIGKRLRMWPARLDSFSAASASNSTIEVITLSPVEKGSLPVTITGQKWKSYADELRRTDDIQRIKELIMLLEEAIFNRQQELVLDADKIEKSKIQQEELGLQQALDLMLEMKTTKLGFPEIR